MGNALQSGGTLNGIAVLDLYAGSGALGLELLSRGAKSLVAVENDRRALEALRANVALLLPGSTDAESVDAPSEGPRITVLSARVSAALARLAGRSFDVVVADPPYELPDVELQAVLMALLPLLAPDAEIVVERSSRSGELFWPTPIAAGRAKRYGDTMLCYGRAP